MFGAGTLEPDTPLMLLAIEADLQPFELRDYLRREIERRRAGPPRRADERSLADLLQRRSSRFG